MKRVTPVEVVTVAALAALKAGLWTSGLYLGLTGNTFGPALIVASMWITVRQPVG